MGTKTPPWVKVVGAILDLLQVAVAIAVIVLTIWKLISIDIEGLNGVPDVDKDATCVLDGTESSSFISGTRFCIYAIAVGVISLLVNLIFAFIRKCIKCVVCNVGGVARIISLISDIALAIWWGVAFALFLSRGRAANDAGYPNRSARDGVIALAFGGLMAFCIDAFLIIWTLVK